MSDLPKMLSKREIELEELEEAKYVQSLRDNIEKLQEQLNTAKKTLTEIAGGHKLKTQYLIINLLPVMHSQRLEEMMSKLFCSHYHKYMDGKIHLQKYTCADCGKVSYVKYEEVEKPISNKDAMKLLKNLEGSGDE